MLNFTFKMALCQGRHEIKEAINGSIFEKEVNPLEIKELEKQAFYSISRQCTRFQLLEPVPSDTEGVDCFCIPKGLKLDLYVTGLTVALIAVLNVCRQEGIKVTLYHFNRETGTYYPQEVR